MQILPSAIFSIGSYFLAQLLFRRCRFSLKPLVSPVNWFLLLFCMQLVVTPIVVLITGVSSEFIPLAPSEFATNFALVLYTIGFWFFCLAVHIHRKRQPVLALSTIRKPGDSWFPPRWLVVSYAIIGIIGVIAFFKSPARLIMYFVSPQLYISDTETGGSTSFADAASIFLRTFLPFSIIMLWCRGVASSGASKGLLSRVRGPLLIFLVAITAPLYSYERASLVIPMVAISAVMLKQKGKAALIKVGAVAAVVVVFVSIITSYRADPAAAGLQKGASTVDFYQLYGMAPQYLGLLLEKTHYGNPPYLGSVSVASVMDPLPVLGKPFRQSSGTAIFTSLDNRPELPAAFAGEVFLDFSFLGVMVAFYLVGRLIAALQNRFELANEPLQIYTLQLISVWFSYAVTLGIEEITIALVYLLWPVYAFFYYRRRQRLRQTSQGMLPNGEGVSP